MPIHHPAALRCLYRADLRRRIRTGRRTAGVTLLATAAALALGALAAPGATAAAASPTTASPTTASPTTASEPSPITGVLDRLAVEPSESTGRRASDQIPTAWLRTVTDRIPIDADAVRDIPTGSTVAVRLAAPQIPSDATRPHKVASVVVLVRASSAADTARGAAVHSVTVVLALPAGATPNRTTAGSLSRTVNADVARFWSRASDGRIGLTVTKTVGWTRLSSSCADVWAVWDEVTDRIGFTPGPRRHLLVYAPPGAGCPTGLATVGRAPDAGGNVMIGGVAASLMAHELGHNLGLGHSQTLACPETTDGVVSGNGFSSGCHRVPYGDWYDVMGISWDNLGSLSTAHAYRLGLLPPSAVVTTRGPVRVTLRPVSTRTGVRSLRIQDRAGATYVVEYRPASGADAWLATDANWRGLRAGALLRRIDPKDATATLLLDPTPPGNSPDGEDVDVTLPSGRGVTTASGHVSIKVESTTPDAATVAVALDGVWPTLVVEPRGRLINGRQVTIGQALAAWGAIAP